MKKVLFVALLISSVQIVADEAKAQKCIQAEELIFSEYADQIKTAAEYAQLMTVADWYFLNCKE